jgi:gamma-glutamyl phosphate reductase
MALLDSDAAVDVGALMHDMGARAREASRAIALASTDTKNAALACHCRGHP